MRRMRRIIGCGLVAAAALGCSAATSAARASAPAPKVSVLARGLDNPRGLAFLRDGRLAVAEAGHAGSLCLGPGECVGLNGQVSAITLRNGHTNVLATGLPSFAGPFAR